MALALPPIRQGGTAGEACDALREAGWREVGRGDWCWVFADPGERQAVEDVARAAGVPFTGLWLDVTREVALARVAARKGDASDATPQVVERQQAYDLGLLTWARVDAGRDTDVVTADARRTIGA